jgi:acyl carrier protein
MSESLRERVHHVVSSVLGIPPASIHDHTSPDTVPTWDSMQHLQLVLALEQEFGAEFQVEEIEAMQRVGVIVTVLEERTRSR